MPRKTKQKKAKGGQRSKRFRIGRSDAGLGLFALRLLVRRELVIEYTGEKISSEEAERRGGRYLFDIDKDLVLDAKAHKHIARYINHSCAPNCFAERDMEERRVYIYAKRRIEPGEELSYNYGKLYWNDIIGGAKRCRCDKCKESRRHKVKS